MSAGSITLNIALFGAFRPYSDGAPLSLDLPRGATLSDVREGLKAALRRMHPGFDKDALVDESALADESRILPEDTVFSNGMALAILPPVCGG